MRMRDSPVCYAVLGRRDAKARKARAEFVALGPRIKSNGNYYGRAALTMVGWGTRMPNSH